jgi:hypothetical protein
MSIVNCHACGQEGTREQMKREIATGVFFCDYRCQRLFKKLIYGEALMAKQMWFRWYCPKCKKDRKELPDCADCGTKLKKIRVNREAPSLGSRPS